MEARRVKAYFTAIIAVLVFSLAPNAAAATAPDYGFYKGKVILSRLFPVTAAGKARWPCCVMRCPVRSVPMSD